MTTQWQQYYGSDEPAPVSDEFVWTKKINGALEQLHHSIPARVRLFLDDGNTAWAIADGDVIASGTDHTSVIQAAIDHVFNSYTDTSERVRTQFCKGWVDGGGTQFTVTDTVQLKDQVGLCNIDLDAAENTMSGAAVLDVSSAATNVIVGVPLRFVRVRNAANGPGMRIDRAATMTGHGVQALDCAGVGITIQGSTSVLLTQPRAFYNGGAGIEITDHPNRHGNLNQIYEPHLYANGTGIHVHKDDQPGDDTDVNLIEGGNIDDSDGAGVLLGDGACTTVVRNCWSEGDAFVVDGPNQTARLNRFRDNKIRDIQVKTAAKTQLRDNFTTKGDTSRPMDITITSAATDTRLDGNELSGGTLTDNGVRTVENGVGTNAGDPRSSGTWNGNGREGLVVYDTSAGRPWPAYRYVDGQWQPA